MPTLHVRNIREDLYERLRAQAEAHGRSIGAEVEQLLAERLGAPPSPRRRRRGNSDPLGPDAREVVEIAQEEVRTLGHGAIGTEHLLLGVLALRSLPGLTLEQARVDVAAKVGHGPGTPDGQIPFTPGAKKVLELALREARPEPPRAEHIALALERAKEGVGSDLIRIAVPSVRRLRKLLEADNEPERFRVVDLDGTAADWEAQLNAAAAEGYELVSTVERRAVLARG